MLGDVYIIVGRVEKNQHMWASQKLAHTKVKF